MQPDYGPRTDMTCPTSGGSTTLVNGDESLVIPKHQHMGCVYAELGEGEDHTVGVYRKTSY